MTDSHPTIINTIHSKSIHSVMHVQVHEYFITFRFSLSTQLETKSSLLRQMHLRKQKHTFHAGNHDDIFHPLQLSRASLSSTHDKRGTRKPHHKSSLAPKRQASSRSLKRKNAAAVRLHQATLPPDCTRQPCHPINEVNYTRTSCWC